MIFNRTILNNLLIFYQRSISGLAADRINMLDDGLSYIFFFTSLSNSYFNDKINIISICYYFKIYILPTLYKYKPNNTK